VGGGGSLFLELDLPTGLFYFLYSALLLSTWVSFAVYIGLFCFHIRLFRCLHRFLLLSIYISFVGR